MLPVLTTKTEDPDGMDSTVELVECSPEQKIERVESFPNVSLIKTCLKLIREFLKDRRISVFEKLLHETETS